MNAKRLVLVTVVALVAASAVRGVLEERLGAAEQKPSEESFEEVFFDMPVDLDAIDFENGDGLTPFGIHALNHVEGRKHVAICVKLGTAVKAPADGVVFMISQIEPGDYELVIRHGNRFVSEFYHLREVVVEEGEQVSKGQCIGYLREDMGPYAGKTGCFDWALFDRMMFVAQAIQTAALSPPMNT